MNSSARRKELERRIKSLSNSRPVWIAIGCQVAALIFPFAGVIAISIMLMWLAIAGMARWATEQQLKELDLKERQAEADAKDFIDERSGAIFQRMQATLEASARQTRADYMRNKMRLMLDEERARQQAARARALSGRMGEEFKGNCIDITPEIQK
jgi:hypothetical protein